MAQMVRNLPEMQGPWVQSLGQGDPLEEGMATHSSILAWRIPWTEEPGGCKESDTAANNSTPSARMYNTLPHTPPTSGNLFSFP